MNISKHHKILITLYALTFVLLSCVGYVLLILSQECLKTADSGIGCAIAVTVSISLPLLLGGLPIYFLMHKSAITTKLLWGYSIFIAVIIIPIGTALGVYTMYYLKMRDNENV